MSPSSNNPSLPRLDAFLADRRMLNREQFTKKYAAPVLLIPLKPEGTLQDDGAFRTQQVTSELQREAAVPASRLTAVIAVEKRMADPFQAFIWVGRESRCDVTLPFNSVSKLQAQFLKKPTGEFELLDAGSTNGTFIEGTKLEKNKPVTLRDSIQLRFGKIDARFRTAEGFYEELGKFL